MDLNKLMFQIKHKRKEPFQPKLAVLHEFSKWTQRIFHLDNELDRFILSERDYFDLINEAFASNIHYSTQLEGNLLPIDEVRRLTRRSLSYGPSDEERGSDNQEIINHLIGWLYPIFESPWNIEFIKSIHSILMDGDDKARPGEFRDFRSSVYTSEGMEVFITAPPEYIGEELETMLNWLNTTGPGFSPVVAATIMFHEFESIHPFVDGNGRCGRTLFHGYLQNHGLPNAKLCLIEKEIVKDPEFYYNILGWTDEFGDYSDLVIYFTKAVLKSYEEAVERYQKKDLLGGDLDEISKRLLVKAKHWKRPFTLRNAREWCEASSDFVLRDRLTELEELGALRKVGRTRGLRYQFADAFDEICQRFQKTHEYIKAE